MKNKTRKVGEVFNDSKGNKIEVVRTNLQDSHICCCDGCIYDNLPICENIELIGFCSYQDRTDNQDIIFKEVNENEKLASLKSILILVQQLQLKYYGKINIDIELYGIAFDVTVKIGGKLRAFEFSEYESENWKPNYYKIINHIKQNG